MQNVECYSAEARLLMVVVGALFLKKGDDGWGALRSW